MKKIILISIFLFALVFEGFIIYKFLNYILYKSSLHEFSKISVEKIFFMKWIVWGVIFIIGSFVSVFLGRYYAYNKCCRIQNEIINYTIQNDKTLYEINKMPSRLLKYNFYISTLFDFFSWKNSEHLKIKKQLLKLQEKINKEFSKINIKDFNFL